MGHINPHKHKREYIPKNKEAWEDSSGKLKFLDNSSLEEVFVWSRIAPFIERELGSTLVIGVTDASPIFGLTPQLFHQHQTWEEKNLNI